MKITRYYQSLKSKANDTLYKRMRRHFYLIVGGILYSVIFYIYIFLRYFIRWLFRVRPSFKYDVSICAVFMNEGKYLREWVEYHRLIGVDHIYLYNNNSTDNYLDILTPYIEEGYITLTNWPEKYGQKKIYADCCHRFGQETRWIGYIDLDEFVNLRQFDNIKDMFRKFRAFPVLYLCWKMFGTSGYMDEPETYLVTERYTSCWENLCNTGKSFINNEFSNFSFVSPHYYASHIRTKKGLIDIPVFGVSDMYTFAYGNDFFFEFFYRFHKPKAYINHYWSKSYGWYDYKDRKRGSVCSAGRSNAKKTEGRFEAHELKNSSKDYSIQRFLIPLKIAMGEKATCCDPEINSNS